MTNQFARAKMRFPDFRRERKMRLGLIFGIVLAVLLVVIMWNRGRPPAP
ncbi:MAG: hypothetical protein ACJ8AJ_00895 [Gemmatimonadaceae bacterium]